MKKFICTVLTFVLVLSLLVPASFAAGKDNSWIVYEVEKTNDEIENLVDQAINDVEEEIRKYNQQIMKIESLDINTDKLVYEIEIKLKSKISKIINRLIDDTNIIADKMIENAAKYGIKVICEYVEVEIGNQKVLIDPLRVVGF